jgi:uncharacterized membrane protein
MMDPFLLEWLNILVRWGHLVAGIAWIGTSFYFVALDLSLRNGEAWEVHGGGFYNVRKHMQAPAELPPHLIWFKWEAYLTWITGFLLLIVQYYVQADIYLIDPSVMALNTWQAIGISVASLLAGWTIYNALCNSPIGKHTGWLALGVFALILAAAYGFSQVFSGRGAFIHIGAFIGTMMAANVFAVIIPNQSKITAALLRGEVPDPKYGAIGKQRSLHNTYLTLPVLFMMTSNHYALITGYSQIWVLVGLIVLGGGVARHFLLRTEVHDEMAEIAWTIPVIALCLVGAVMLTQPDSLAFPAGLKVSDDEAFTIVQNRCVACHAANPADSSVKQAPKGIMFTSVADMKRYATQIETQAVRNKAMPMGNKTGMLLEERQKLGAWLQAQK